MDNISNLSDINLYIRQHQQFQTERKYIVIVNTYIRIAEKISTILRKFFLFEGCDVSANLQLSWGRGEEKRMHTEAFCQLPYFLGN